MNDTRARVLDRREQRLDQAYWMQIELMDELRYEYTPEPEMESAYERLDRIATLLAKASDMAFAHRFEEARYDAFELAYNVRDAHDIHEHNARYFEGVTTSPTNAYRDAADRFAAQYEAYDESLDPF